MNQTTSTPIHDGNRLSLCASALLSLAIEEEALLRDLDIFGGGELSGKIVSATAAKSTAILRAHGFETSKAFEVAAAERTSARWVHFSPLSAALSYASELEDRAAQGAR